MRVDGIAVTVPDGATLLEACDTVGRYVPRLCSYPGLGCCTEAGVDKLECGLCAVRLQDGSVVLACVTVAAPGMEVSTQDSGLAATRLERLARILSGHPHVCPVCPDRDGCTRDHCTYGYPMDARCCDEFGRCELGKLVVYLDPEGTTSRGVVTVTRKAVTEGRIRREPGLCVGCGRCVAVCDTSPQAGSALEMVSRSVDPAKRAGTTNGGNGPQAAGSLPEGSLPAGFVARPKRDTLRASGCTFCGQCVMVCPAGALTAPGEEGARWLAGRGARSDMAAPVLPPEAWHEVGAESLAMVPLEAGVFQLLDSGGRVLRIGGVPDLRQGLARALAEPACAAAVRFTVEIDPLFTQRESELLARYAGEHGHLPSGNDLTDELFGEDLLEDDI
jgi:ferredoxin